jgi:peptide/nickel transport system permease protein
MSSVAVTAPPRRRRRTSLILWAGAVLVGLHVAIGLLSLVWLPYDPNAFTAAGWRAPPGCTGSARTGSDATCSRS